MAAEPLPQVGIVDFLEAIFPPGSQGKLGITSGNSFAPEWFSRDEFARASVYAGRSTVYFHTCLHDVDLLNKLNAAQEKPSQAPRGRDATALTVPGAWLDIDILTTARKREGKKLPPDLASARTLLREAFPVEPSIVVNSGGGMHAYYLLKEAFDTSSADGRAEASSWVSAVELTVREIAASKGWKLDKVSDLARILRLPGTVNAKPGQAVSDVSIMEWRPDLRSNPEDFEPYLVKPRAHVRAPGITSDDVNDDPAEPANFYAILQKCGWMRNEVFQGGATLPEPEWYAAASILSRCKDGREIFHTVSKSHPKYREAETEAKFNHGRDSAPNARSCQWIYEATSGKHCKSCKFWWAAKGPLELGSPAADGAERYIPGEDAETVDEKKKVLLTMLSATFSLPEIRDVLLRGSQEPDLEVHFVDGRVARLGPVEKAMRSEYVDGILTASLLQVTWTGGKGKAPNKHWQKKGLDILIGVARKVETWTEEEETLEWVSSFASQAEDASGWDAERRAQAYRGDSAFVSGMAKSWTEGGSVFFRPSDFLGWLQVYLRLNITSVALAKRLSRAGFTRTRLSTRDASTGSVVTTKAWSRQWPPDLAEDT